MSNAITEHSYTAQDHTTAYLAAGPEDGPLMVFVHGWPEQSLSWRHQLPVFGGLGFRAIAPDMRGYGRSSIYLQHADYAQELVVADMLRLLNGLGRDKAIWIGHDWGSPTVWNLTNHHPQRCSAVANLCVPYAALDRGLDATLEYVDRDVYPRAEFPAGQWEYMRFYEQQFDAAIAPFEANPYNTVKALFRKGNPRGQRKPSPTAYVRKQHGWFGGAAEAPDVPRDADVVSEDDLYAYSEALSRNGFFGPCSYYMNHDANAKYAAKALTDGVLEMPVLFLHGLFDYTCETTQSRLAEPMRALCRNLTERTIESGHWMAQERPCEVNAALAQWLETSVPGSFGC